MAATKFIQNDLFDKGIQTKKCTLCKQDKPLCDFFRVKKPGRRTRGGLRLKPTCKQCSYERINEWKKRDPERFKNYNKKCTLKRFGKTIDEYKRMLADQNGLCAICKRPETAPSRVQGSRELSVDHDHRNGLARGLLCATCNLAIGYFMDNPEIMRAAADYVEHHRKIHESPLK